MGKKLLFIFIFYTFHFIIFPKKKIIITGKIFIDVLWRDLKSLYPFNKVDKIVVLWSKHALETLIRYIVTLSLRFKDNLRNLIGLEKLLTYELI